MKTPEATKHLEKPPTWNCGRCGKVLLAEKPVNTACITEF
jgi:hypothetical protein